MENSPGQAPVLFADSLSPRTPIPGPLGLGNFHRAGEGIRSQLESEKCGLRVAAGEGLVRHLQGPLAGEAWAEAGGREPDPGRTLRTDGLGWLFSPQGSRPFPAGLDSDNNTNDPYLRVPGTLQ